MYKLTVICVIQVFYNACCPVVLLLFCPFRQVASISRRISFYKHQHLFSLILLSCVMSVLATWFSFEWRHCYTFVCFLITFTFVKFNLARGLGRLGNLCTIKNVIVNYVLYLAMYRVQSKPNFMMVLKLGKVENYWTSGCNFKMTIIITCFTL